MLFAPGVAVRVTFEPAEKLALHVPGQLIPVGLLVTVPVPVPAEVTVSGYDPRENVAPTDSAAVISTVHVVVPEHAPVQPPKV